MQFIVVVWHRLNNWGKLFANLSATASESGPKIKTGRQTESEKKNVMFESKFRWVFRNNTYNQAALLVDSSQMCHLHSKCPNQRTNSTACYWCLSSRNPWNLLKSFVDAFSSEKMSGGQAFASMRYHHRLCRSRTSALPQSCRESSFSNYASLKRYQMRINSGLTSIDLELFRIWACAHTRQASRPSTDQISREILLCPHREHHLWRNATRLHSNRQCDQIQRECTTNLQPHP